MKIKDLKEGMKLKFTFNDPPMTAKFEVVKVLSYLYIKCTNGFAPKLCRVSNLGAVTLFLIEEDK